MIQQASHEKWVVPAQDLRSLLALDADAFVECAYLTILGRGPDASGLAHYRHRLSSGHSKLEILRDIYASDEARAIKRKLPWLARALWIRRIITISPATLLSKILPNRTATLSKQIRALEVKISAIEKALSSLNERHNELLLQSADSTTAAQSQHPLSTANPEEIPNFQHVPHSGARSVLAARIFQELLDSKARIDANIARKSLP
jgi:Domain of unknown function (DUF4214)